MKKCKKCVLPENYPGIRFNHAGVCNYCLTHKKMRCRRKEELDKFLKSFRNENRDFDIVVGISGGRDSSYLLYYLVKMCKLNVLAYSADNGFVSQKAKTNMKEMTDILNVKLLIEKHDFLKKCFKNNLSSWLRKPSPGMIQMICCGCRLGMYRGLLRCAKKYQIPLVAYGSTELEKLPHKRTFLTTNPLGNMIGVRNIKSLSLLLGLLYEALRNPFYFLNPMNLIIYIKESLYCLPLEEFFLLETMRKLLYPNQKILYFYQYVKWDEKRILSTIEKGFNLRALTWRSDCKVSHLKNYLLKKTVGFTDKDAILSNMIRENMITREEALERLCARAENTIPQKSITELFAELTS